jgi:septum formation protein
MTLASVQEPLILLASGSPRRQQLLRKAGLDPKVFPVSLHEDRLNGESPTSMAMRLAQSKAEKAFGANPAGDFVLAADTLVVDGDRILGKPKDSEDAAAMLMGLRNREHVVMTGLALIERDGAERVTRIKKTTLRLRDYSLGEVEAYVGSADPLDKAGAYGIQDSSFQPVVMEGFEGCYTNVMGLPLCTLHQAFADLGVDLGPDIDLLAACYEFHHHSTDSESFVAA